MFSVTCSREERGRVRRSSPSAQPGTAAVPLRRWPGRTEGARSPSEDGDGPDARAGTRELLLLLFCESLFRQQKREIFQDFPFVICPQTLERPPTVPRSETSSLGASQQQLVSPGVLSPKVRTFPPRFRPL